jgi:hypothetical protein
VTTIGRGAHISQNELLGHLPPLKGKTTQVKFLAQHPELLKAEVVSWLADAVREQAKTKIDTARAIMLAEFAVTIAHKLGDQAALGQSFRAMGNAFYVSVRTGLPSNIMKRRAGFSSNCTAPRNLAEP